MSVAEIVNSVETLSQAEWNELWQVLEKKRAYELALEFKATLGETSNIYTPLDSYDAAAALTKFLESNE
jgi:hypothetical protein